MLLVYHKAQLFVVYHQIHVISHVFQRNFAISIAIVHLKHIQKSKSAKDMSNSTALSHFLFFNKEKKALALT